MDEAGGGGGGQGAVLREDGYLRSALAAASVRFHAGLNVLLLRAASGELHVLDVHSGLVLQSSRLSSQNGLVGAEYVPGAERVLVWDSRGVSARTDYNGVLLLHTALQQPITSTQGDRLIKMELVLSEAVLLFQCLEHFESLSVEGLNEVKEELKKAINVEIPKKGVKAQKWSTVCLELPQATLRLVANAIVSELKSQNRRIPALSIASAVGQRASDLGPPSRTKEIRALMYSEAARRDTFKRWPHMDYKWALPAQMAQAGFYHQPSTTGDDRAVCFTCVVCLVCWEKSDEPWVEHERHSPNCPFVRGEYTHNVPLSVTNATSCAVPSHDISVVSQGNTGHLVATGTSEGVVTIWKLDCGLKQFKNINVSPYDSIFSGILSSDSNKVWTDSFEKDQYIYSLKLTAMAFIGLVPEESVLLPTSLGETPDKNQTTKERPKPALICAVTIARTETAQSNPSIHEDNSSEKNLFNSGTDSPSDEYVKAMNDQNQGRNKNKSLYLLTYFVHGSVAASTTTVVQSGGATASSGTGAGSKPGGSKKAPAIRPDDSNIYDEIFQYSDEDAEMPPCSASLIDDHIDMMAIQAASSSKGVDAKIWEPKKILVTKHLKMYPNKIYPLLYPSNPNASNLEHPIVMLPDMLSGSEVTESVQNFVGHISNLKKWKTKESESNTGTKVSDQTDSAVLHSADGIHYINMNGPLEISDLKWYEEKAYSKTGTQTSANNGNSEGFDSDTAEEIVPVCYAIQCLSLPNKLNLREDSQVTHLMPTANGTHLLVVVSHATEVTVSAPTNTNEDENIDMDEIYRFMNGSTTSSDTKSETAAPCNETGAYLILYKVDDRTSTLTLDETPVAFEALVPGIAPVDLCMLPGGKNDQPSVAIIGEDGTLRLYSLPDLHLITEKSVPQSPFVSVAFCTSVERLSVCTKSGTLHFYALTDGESDSGDDTDEDETSNLDIDVSPKAAPTEGGFTQPILAHKQDLDLYDLETFLELTSTHTSVPYAADVPGFWCELSPAQRPRSDHLNNRTWRLQNTSSTWDEHILELTLPSSMNLAHIQLQFTLHPSQQHMQALPLIQVTLLKQNLNGIGYEKDVTALLGENLKPGNDAKDSQRQEFLEHLKAHEAEIIAGPLLLASGLDLTMQSGTLTLTSPRLYRAKGKTFLVHIKTLYDPSKDMIKGKISDTSTAKKADYIGCDWLHQISITVRRHPDGPQERQQRIAMLESNTFLSNLLAIAIDRSDVEKMTKALDLAMWIISIRLQRFRVVSDITGTSNPDGPPSPVEILQMECIKIVEKNIDSLLQNCVLRMKRSIAKKCIKILLITSDGAKHVPRIWECTFERSLAESVSRCVMLLGACNSPGSMCWLARLAIYAGGGSGTALQTINQHCLQLLEMLAAEVLSRPDRYRSLLCARFGLYGFPLERTIFDAEGPALGKSSSVPVTYASVLAGETTPSVTTQQPRPDHQLKDLFNMAGDIEGKKGCNGNAWWNQPSGPDTLSAGKLESMALHVTCHTASDGTKLEQTGGRQIVSAVTALHGDTAQLWGAMKECQMKLTQSQESDSLEDGENSLMECDTQEKQFPEQITAKAQEPDICGIPWAQLVTRPPQPTLVVERMHSGARRFIVLDFGHPILLTDLIIPSCSDLVTLSVDFWLHSEEQDATKLAFATDISSKNLVLTDIQPPPLCRYLKITTIGRYGMSAMKCKIPLGWFYGELAEIANPQASISALASLQQELACRFRLSTAKLKDLLNPYLELYNGNAAHMMAFLKTPSDSDVKVQTAYQECIELQQQLHTVRNVLEKLRKGSSASVQPAEEWSPQSLLAAASTDKLRVMLDHLLHILLYFNCHIADEKPEEISRESCAQITKLLWWSAPRPAAALSTLLVKLCGALPWWGRLIADTLVGTFAVVDTPPLPQDRCLILLIYMARKSLLASPSVEHGVVEALAERALRAVESNREPALASCLLVVLAACLDSLPAPSPGWHRWDFVTGGRPGGVTSEPYSQQAAAQIQRRKLQKRLIQHMQEAARKSTHSKEEQRATSLGRRPAPARAAEREPSPDVPLLPLVTQALAEKLTHALLARTLKLDYTTSADMLILSAKVVGRLCTMSHGMVGLVQPQTLLELLKLAATLPPWPRHAIINLLQDLVEYENADWCESWTTTFGGVAPAGSGPQRSTLRLTQEDAVYPPRRLPAKLAFIQKRLSLAGIEMPLASDIDLPLVVEPDGTVHSNSQGLEWLDQYYSDTVKRAIHQRPSNTNTFISVCMDARLESGMEAHGEVMARQLLLRGYNALAAAITAGGAVAVREPEPRRPTPPTSAPFTHTLLHAFQELAYDFVLQDDCKLTENVVALWLTLNGCAWGNSNHLGGISLSVPPDKPRIPLSTQFVELLLASLVRWENVSLRCWVLSMQTLAWIANLPIHADGVAQTMGRVILDSEHFVPAIVKFVNINVSTDGTISGVDSYLGGAGVGAGVAATSVLQSALTRVMSGRSAVGAYAALRCVCGVDWRDASAGRAHDLRAMLLRTALTLVPMLTAKHAQHAVSLMNTVACLTCDWMSTKRSGGDVVSNSAGTASESGADSMLTGLLADAFNPSDNVKGVGRRAPCHRSVLVQLLHLCRRLLTIPLNSPTSEGSASAPGTSAAEESQTDESKQQQQHASSSAANLEDERKQSNARHACIADIVLQHKPTMQRLFRALSVCQAPVGSNVIMEQLSSEAVCVWEELLKLVGVLSATASHPSLLLTNLLSFLRRKDDWALSDALVWFILRALEKPEALNTFIEMNGIEVITERLTSSHCAQLNSRPGLVSSLMNYLKLPVQLVNMSTTTTAANKSKQVAPVDTNDGLMNFAPLCTVTCGNPTAQAADVLLGGGAATTATGSCAARRARAPAWSYHFFSAEDTSLTLSLTLPYAIQLHEVQLQPHVNSLATCPGAVGVEAGSGGTLSPLGPPQNTAGMTFIRLVLTQPVVATTVQVLLYKPRDSSNMGLLNLRLLGTPAFSSVPSVINNCANSSSGWIRILALCVSSGRMDASRWSTVVSEGTMWACAALLMCGATAANGRSVLLAASLAYPVIQHPLMRRLLSMDSLAHVRAYQSGESDSNSAINAICELLAQLCTHVDEYTRDRMETFLAWLAESADSWQQQMSQDGAEMATSPSSAYVQCLAEVLWTAKENRLVENLEELLPDELFVSLNSWVKAVPESSLLKKSLDSVLCSICYIRPNLFTILLQELEMNRAAMEEDTNNDGMEGLTDDGKVEWEGVGGAAGQLQLTPARLATIGAAAMTPHTTTMLLHSTLPKRIVDAITQFSLDKLQSLNQASNAQADVHMTDSDKAKDQAMGASTPENIAEPVPLALMPALVEWVRGLCAERRLKDWFGGSIGSLFWRPLLLALCFDRVDRGWREGELVAELEENTIQLFTSLTTCHPHNQRLFATTLHQILDTHANAHDGNTGISGFTRALILRLLLSSERATIGVRWAPGANAPSPSPPVPGRHPATHRHHLLTLPLHTTVRSLLRDHIAPAMSSSKWSSGATPSASGSGLQRSASDSGIHTAMEAFELSVAAAKTAKDKRSKDASNNTIKQQIKKRHQCRLVSNQSDNTSNEDLVTGLRVQADGIEGMVSPNVTLEQVSESSPHVFGPHIKLTLHYANKLETVTVWEGKREGVSGQGRAAVLREFGAVGGLALVAAQLPRPHVAAPHAQPASLHTQHDHDWVKLDDSYEEVVELGLSTAPVSDDAGCSGVPPHALIALGLLLKLPGYAEALLNEGPRAIHLLRLLLGVTDDEDGRNIVISGNGNTPTTSTGEIYHNMPRSLGTLPFRVISSLLEAAPRNTDDGRLLRRSLLAVGAVRLIVGCLAVFTHHQPETPPGEGSNGNSTRSRADDKMQLYWAKGTGYGTGSTQQSWNVEQALMRQRIEEEHVTVLLQVLASYIMPTSQWPPSEEIFESADREASDIQPEFVETLARSALLPAICSYLRNDSVLDMSRHIPLYVCVLRCARALWTLRSRALAPAMRPVPRLLRQMSFTANSYASKLRLSKRIAQGKLYSYSQRINVNELGEDDEGLANLIIDIHSTSIAMSRTDCDEDGASGGVSRPITGATREARYIEVMKRLQFESFEMMEECADNGYRFAVSYHFESAVRSSGDRTHPTRMKRLAQEAATLSTSLPLSYSSSVFVRTDTDRLDVMKVLITGPSDTPYANGCFVLDVYFPADYPSVPMLINLETTGRHTVRFNPNLYNDGKVCLSVLNTWHGRPEEKWNAHTSSFLQVLVSIQSLILVPEPYFNEPGYERSRGTRVGSHASTEYNSNIYQACVRWAMLDHLRNPSPCFKQVIQTHFWIKRKEVMETISSWITELEGQGGDKRTQRNISGNLTVLKRLYIKIQEELAKLTVPDGLEDLDEPFTIPAPPPATIQPFDTTPAAAPHDDIDHDMEKLVSAVLQEPAPP